MRVWGFYSCPGGGTAPVFHQGVGHEHQPGLLAFTLARQPGLRVRSALVGGIAAPFPMEVNRWVARVGIGCPRRITVPGFEALQAGCRLNQGSIHREALVRQQAVPLRFQHHLAEQSLAHSMPQQPLPVLGEGGGIEAGLNQVHIQKPPEEEVVVQLFAECPFTAHRVQGNQQ